MKSKVFSNAQDALFDIKSGSTIMSGGFGLCGIPENSIHALAKMNINDLTVISNNISAYPTVRDRCFYKI